MQLLTASKLSTVAMLAMAAVLHFSVSAVPMEQPGPAGEAPAVRTPPDFSAYESAAEGDPSEQAIKDMAAIFKALPLPDENENEPSSSGDASQPVELTEEAINHLNIVQLKKHARQNQGQSELVKKRLSQLADELPRQLDKMWDDVKSKADTGDLFSWPFKGIITASSAWEKPVREMLGLDQLEECPYDLLPYSKHLFKPGHVLQGPHPREEELYKLILRDDDTFGWKYAIHNICRLAVNGVYPWLLRIATVYVMGENSQVFDVLSQLRAFTPDKAFARDLDELLKLFATINRAHDKVAIIPVMSARPLILSTPEVIPALCPRIRDMPATLLLYLAAKEHKKGGDVHLVVDGKNLLETLKLGDINDIVYNNYLNDYHPARFENYARHLVNTNFELDEVSHVIKRKAVNKLLDQPSSRVGINKATRQLEVNTRRLRLYLFDVLVSILDLKQFVDIYGSISIEYKPLQLIIMAGRSRKGSDIMKYVFQDQLGKEKAIKDGVQVDRQRLNVNHLALLVQGCAVAHTEQNWPVFVELFVEKVKHTEQLPGIDSSSITIGQQVANAISNLVRELDVKLKSYKFNNNVEAEQDSTEAIREVTNRMSQVVGMLGSGERSSESRQESHPSMSFPR